MARFQRMMGRDVRFQTGTDEHGLKIAQKARDLGVSPRALCDEMSGHFRDLFDKLDVSYDRFIRTTEPAHHRASQALWQAMADNGDLYLDRYEGWYSVSRRSLLRRKRAGRRRRGREAFAAGHPGRVGPSRRAGFFRLSAYGDRLLAFLPRAPRVSCDPESRRNEVLRFVEGGLRDLSVSRSSFDWGVAGAGIAKTTSCTSGSTR